MSTKIEWTDETWNPVTGCDKVSQGCKNCYAERLAERFWGERKFTDVMVHPERLDIPLKWKKPRRIFVNSMSDLFHEDVPSSFIDDVFRVMNEAHWHTFQVLTKRPERMALETRIISLATTIRYPMKNVWLGVSCEDQKTADVRIPILLDIPAAVRFVSLEPLLGMIDLNKKELICKTWRRGATIGIYLDWVIVGGESGPNARPMHPDWVRSIRDQCQEAGVPFFFKQWGEWLPNNQVWEPRQTIYGEMFYWEPGITKGHSRRVGKKAAGRMLDGRKWNEFPEEK